MENKHETILVVDDEDMTRRNLHHILTKVGYKVVTAENGIKALELIRTENFDLVITDFKMQEVDGMEVLRVSRELMPFTEVIMVTGYATVDMAVQAMKEGAYLYIAKPFKIDHVRNIVREALLKRNLRIENIKLKNQLKESRQVPSLIGKSQAMKKVRETINQIAGSDAGVVVLGESGTGKELAAKAIHSLSSRSEKKFIAFNCGAFTEELMANELFGHEKEAYTGAGTSRAGLLETATGGTVFLDEIGDMPVTMQVKLLRAIQEKEILRVGGVKPISIDVRFIAATHRDLARDIEKGRFRQDLYYRLNVISLKLPPLIEREGDIPMLVRHFLKDQNHSSGKEVFEIDREAMNLLCSHSWPGNVRELENVIERAVALTREAVIRKEDLPDYIATLSLETYRHDNSSIPTLEEQEKRYIKWIMEKCEGNKTRAAKIMGIDRVSLWRKIKRFQLDVE